MACALRHLAGASERNGPHGIEDILAYPEQVVLDLVYVGHGPAAQHIRGTRHTGNGRSNHARGARLSRSNGYRAIRAQGDKLLGKPERVDAVVCGASFIPIVHH